MANTEHKEHRKIRETELYRYTGMRFQLLLFNIKPLIVVEFVYTLLTGLIMVPLFRIALNAVVKVAGYESVSVQNASGLLLNPVTLICLLALIVVAAIYSLLDTSAAIYTIDCSRQHVKVTIASIAKFSIKNAVRAVMPKNLLIILVVLVMLPLVSMGVSSSFLGAIEIPAGVTDILRDSTWLLFGSLAVLVIMLVLSTRWMYAIHYYTLEQVDFITAINRSRHLIRGNRIRNLISMLIVQALIALVSNVLLKGGAFVVMLLVMSVGAANFLGALLITVVAFVFCIAIAAFDSLGIPISCLKISAKFYDLKAMSNEEIVSVACKGRPKHSRPRKIARIAGGIIVALLALVVALYLNGIARGIVETPFEGIDRPDVIAFRGDTETTIENTLSSIRKAAEDGADKVSVDVQASRDGQIFLYAGTSFMFSCGVDKNSWDLDYDEISQMKFTDIKAALTPDERIPLLSSALEVVKEEDLGIIVNVGKVVKCDDAIERVIAAAREANCLDRCEIASDNYDDLVKAHSIAPEIRTVFVPGLAFDAFESYGEIDAVAIEALAISPELINEIHDDGKRVYGWRLAGEDSTQSAVVYGIDGIVVSDVKRGISIADNRGYPQTVYELFTSLQSEE